MRHPILCDQQNGKYTIFCAESVGRIRSACKKLLFFPGVAYLQKTPGPKTFNESIKVRNIGLNCQ